MPTIFLPAKREILRVALWATAGVGGLVASRYLGARKITGAERLAEALLDTERLRDANTKLQTSSEAALAGCAAYLLNYAYRASEGIGTAPLTEAMPGYSRTHTHPYTKAAATVLSEAKVTQPTLTYAVTVPEVGDVRGTRHVGALHFSGLYPSRPVPDTVQISLADGYTVQIETQFEVPDYLVMGRNRLFGAADVRDNRGNVGRLNIANDGTITGTVTRDARVIGRFEGQVANGLNFRQYQIEGA